MSNRNDLIVIAPEEASKHGLQHVSIQIDARSAGLSGRKFPGGDAFLKLNGPPGAPLIVMLWDCPAWDGDVESVVRAKLVPVWATDIESAAGDAAYVLGEQRNGMTFSTGSGVGRIAWFATVLARGDIRLLLGIGVGGRDKAHVPASEVLANSAIKRVLETLVIEP